MALGVTAVAGVLAWVWWVRASDNLPGSASRAPTTGSPEASPVASPEPSSDHIAAAAARRFLDGYLSPEGRVIRHDQGSDTVSEGQAYAMLLAVALDDEEAFQQVWSWSREHLQRPDGLLSWWWRGGTIVDPQSAADADLDTSRALLLAAKAFERPDYEAEGLRIAGAILEHETAPAGANLLLVAGPWARTEPYFVNPSYFTPAAYDLLWSITGDERWRQIDVSSQNVLDQLGGPGPGLPSDWARVESSGAARPSASPDGARPPAYGRDAVRVPLRMADDCDGPGKEYAAELWPFFEERRDGGIAAVYDLQGRPQVGYQSAPALVGAAGAASAAGDETAALELLDQAERLDKEQPTYYGGALVALGRVLLTTDLLASCR